MRTFGGSIPDELKTGTISIAEAQAVGVSRDLLRGPAWRRVGWGRYRWAAQEMNEDVALAVLLTSLPEGAALAGATAARRWGLDVPRPAKPDVVVPPGAGVSGRVEGRVRRVNLEPGDVLIREGLPVTSPLRTCFDLACRLSLVEAVVVVDQALYGGLISLESLAGYIDQHHRIPGLVQARRVLELAEPKAESPMESRLRMLLVREGLPRPEAQVSIYGPAGTFLGRLDLFYPDAKVGIEYDGENHGDRLTADNRRQNRLLEAGTHLLRYSAPDLTRPELIVSEVRAALHRHRGSHNSLIAGTRPLDGARQGPTAGIRGLGGTR